ncbi:MAG: HEAT repeat domain-containing protein [Deltaproteobacteria bacterium]|nr:HEAT repeat domain-containing protein [Deltaproteobacteria bacterium]
MIRRAVPWSVFALLLAAAPARAQFGTAPGQGPRSDTPEARHRHQRNGESLDQWVRVLASEDAQRRLEVMDDLGRSADSRAITHLLKALDDPDPRIQAKAIDYLGLRRASDATPVLVRKLFWRGAPLAMRQHILSALGKIGDPSASRSILDFVAQEQSADVRGTGVYALGEIGDLTIRDDLKRLGDGEGDPRVKLLVKEALAKITHLPRPKTETFVPPSQKVVPPVRPGT